MTDMFILKNSLFP